MGSWMRSEGMEREGGTNWRDTPGWVLHQDLEIVAGGGRDRGEPRLNGSTLEGKGGLQIGSRGEAGGFGAGYGTGTQMGSNERVY